MADIGEMLAFYPKQSAITDPKAHARLFDALPSDIEATSRLLHNVLVHNWKVMAAGVPIEDRRRADIEIRPVARLIERIEEAGGSRWDIERRVDDRVIVDCRHFATLLCSILRHRGVPSRTRHGFAAYLQPGHWQSHVICEHWDEASGQWMRIDPDTLQTCADESRFISADAAWRGIRAGTLDSEQFGYGADLRGAWCVRWELVRDFAAINRQEMLTFDIWGLNDVYPFDAQLRAEDASLLDDIASLVADERNSFSLLRALYQSDGRVRVPPVIRSQPYTTGRLHQVDLVREGSLTLA